MKNTTLARSLLIAALSLLQTGAALAQTTAFTYQGRLDDGAAPANGLYDLTFTLHSAANGPTSIGGTLTNTATAVSGGLFTVNLDFGDVFPGADRWLEIGVRASGAGQFASLSPRQKVYATPYAVFASGAGVSDSANAVAAGNIVGVLLGSSIGEGSITSSKLADHAVESVHLSAGAVTGEALGDGAVTADKIASSSTWSSLTLVKSSPAASDNFGGAVAAVGSDMFLVGAKQDDTGATDAGAAYLFSIDGALVRTFTNPTPALSERFGSSVASFGTDRVLVGAEEDNATAFTAGAVYLFGTNGTLLTTFTNPTPTHLSRFGGAIAAVGTNGVLIGAPGDDKGGDESGAAYLFASSGELLATFASPHPTEHGFFGCSVSAVGMDKVLIGAMRDTVEVGNFGAAYLFNTNGVLLQTFARTTPEGPDFFGASVASLGADRVVIGAYGDEGNYAGAVYLYGTGGQLLNTFTNPTPEYGEHFGWSVAVLANAGIVVGGDLRDFGTTYSGAAYLFSTNGALLHTFASPNGEANARFGHSLAAAGKDRVVIGSLWDSVGGTAGGAAYVFSLTQFVPGLVAEAVAPGAINSASLQDRSVTLPALAPSIGVWTREGNDVFRLAGKVGIGTNVFDDNQLVVAGSVAATTFNSRSDRNSKQDFEVADTKAVLAKVAALPITQWRFKESPESIHLGPMAQDFHAAFGLGNDDKAIATVDADGVALAAIQGLNQKLEQRLDQKNAEIADLKARLEKLERMLENQGGAR